MGGIQYKPTLPTFSNETHLYSTAWNKFLVSFGLFERFTDDKKTEIIAALILITLTLFI